MERRRRFPPFGACDYWGDRRVKKEEEDELRDAYICAGEESVIVHKFSNGYAPPGIKYSIVIRDNASISITKDGMLMEVDGGMAALIWEHDILVDHGYSVYFEAEVKQYDESDDEQAYLLAEVRYKNERQYTISVTNYAEDGTVIWDVLNNRLVCVFKKGRCITPPPPGYRVGPPEDIVNHRFIAGVTGHARCFNKMVTVSRVALVTVDREEGDGIYKILFNLLEFRRPRMVFT